MIVIIGLLILLAVGDAFVIVGQSATGLPTGQLFLYAIVVGVIGDARTGHASRHLQTAPGLARVPACADRDPEARVPPAAGP